ncbi:MAG TPA: DNA translocase FtsK [Candidatus Limiplasma sp.]|nr:DNA translocase FtsK [Candidatus Limiplasma sp.]
MASGKRGRAKTYDSDSLLYRSVFGILLIAIGALSLIAIVGGIKGAVFTIVRQVMQGLGGALCIGIPLFLIWGGALAAFSARRKAPLRAYVLLSLLFFCVMGIFNLLSQVGTFSMMEYTIAYNQKITPPIADPKGYWPIITAGYQICSTSGAFGGAFGMITAWPLWTFTGVVPGVVILSGVSLVCVLFFSKFDVLGWLKHYRENSDQRLEAREQKRAQRAYEKQLKARETIENQPEQAAAASTTIPDMPQKPSQQVSMPQGYPAFAGMPAWPQGVPTVNSQQMVFPNMATAPAAPLYDEMIIPEMPDGATTPKWKLKNTPASRTEPSQAEPAAPKPAQPARTGDRDMDRALRKMEENRKQKEELNRRINDAESGGQTDTAYSVDEARLKAAARKARPQIGERDQFPGTGEPQTAQTPRTLSPEQIAYANQTAAYRSPESQPETRDTPKARDPYAAYKKPVQAEDSFLPMSGQKLDTPDLKIPQKTQNTPEKTEDRRAKPYPYPMIELLNLQTQTLPDTRELDRANAAKLEQTLESFGIPAQVQRVTHGPAVTRFELGLISSGINVKRIMNIADNIALDMAANGGVRIEVPIPGTNLFGVEVPNKEIISVSLAEVLTSQEMTNAKSPLSVALGKDIAGRPIICDLAKMPHLLIAGQTGSGKSVCINSIINSLLYRATPDEVRMIMIDPKVVELQGYNRVPHLLIPVVSDPHKASGALAWAVQEMLDRYHKMQSKGVREITAYNAKVKGDEPKLPRIVIIIDELSDLMIACKKEVEESIIRLAQLARAAGIHVVVATQRPTVNVITGLIKANIPSRIAFAVASSIDSRTILDMNGAEKLLGRGDMFYYPTGAKAPMRVQGCFVSDQEISNVADYIGKNSEPDYDESINEIMESQGAEDAPDDADGAEDGELDERLQEAIEMVLTDGQASISMLQRRMKIGYARAGRLIDDMAARGIVSKSAGSKPREILMTYEQYLQKKDMLLR